MAGWIAFDQSQFHCVEPLNEEGQRCSVVLFSPSGLGQCLRHIVRNWNLLVFLVDACEKPCVLLW
eukprot:5667940-Amphidinium_carterae.2